LLVPELPYNHPNSMSISSSCLHSENMLEFFAVSLNISHTYTILIAVISIKNEKKIARGFVFT
jgi:hypothetical protein